MALKNSAISEASAPSTLIMEAPPAHLAAQILGFVHRNDRAASEVVRVLPEVRASIQIMIADPYWLRDTDPNAPWVRLPRVALWGPKYAWCYGYARSHIEAYAVGLTGAGLRAVARAPASELLNKVLPLSQFNPDLAAALDPLNGEKFDAWRARAAATLSDFFAAAATITDPAAPALALLATAETNAVARAADRCGLSARQFRRVFENFYGVSPKRYQRAVRVDRMLKQMHVAPWENDAFSDAPIGFADQPHAIREFRAMIGISPREYLRAKRATDKTLRSVPAHDVAPPEQ